MNEKFQYRTTSCGIENFEFIVSERVQVNPYNSRAMSALTYFYYSNWIHCKQKSSKFESAKAMV